MTMFDLTRHRLASTLAAAALSAAGVLAAATGAIAYDGTNCRAPGNCWEPKPGYPDKVAGSKYDPKHNPAELSKQSQSITEMEARNKKRVEYFQKTGQFVYDVSKIPSN